MPENGNEEGIYPDRESPVQTDKAFVLANLTDANFQLLLESDGYLTHGFDAGIIAFLNPSNS